MNGIVRETVRPTSVLAFYFDPICPWAWRASEWIREVQRQRRVDVHWKFFSLAMANGLDPELILPLRVLSMARRGGGNPAVDRVYLELGRLTHERGEDLGACGLARTVEEALARTGLDPASARAAQRDGSTLEEVAAETEEAQACYGAYGVPWLVLDDRDFGFNGPVLAKVPRGETAEHLWDHLSWMLDQEYFYELKRERTNVSLPVAARNRSRIPVGQ